MPPRFTSKPYCSAASFAVTDSFTVSNKFPILHSSFFDWEMLSTIGGNQGFVSMGMETNGVDWQNRKL
jgi:hypothetical protein